MVYMYESSKAKTIYNLERREYVDEEYMYPSCTVIMNLRK
jgi:hypothetical protein